ncbi:histidine phosphatase family protein [Acetobacter estunensis]|uniref:SixA phosphatase family protein n=1 Tax=Acetobacter estunensis TaxID=104097 RepID=UPI001C2D8F58|nr:histidine phosphatase family protein [Acetobacter estunensis]MBV1838205.1 histidine phosphatase family protein [Acetobacter estunensis]
MIRPVAHRLLLLRHCEAEPARGDEFGSAADQARPLTQAGHLMARRRGESMRRAGLVPDLVLCSPAMRTRQTYAGLLPFGEGARPEIRIEPTLYLAAPDELLARLRATSDSVHTILLVGHNPGLPALARYLNGVERALDSDFALGTLATFQVEVEERESIALTWKALGPRTAWLESFSQN